MLESDGKWQKMSVTEREKIVKVYSPTCTQNLSNTLLDGGSKAEKMWLEGKLEDSLASVEAQALRVSGDITALVRAVSKDVGEGIKVYAKGSSTKFRAWLEKHLPLSGLTSECGRTPRRRRRSRRTTIARLSFRFSKRFSCSTARTSSRTTCS